MQAVHLTAPLEKRFQKRLARNVQGAEEDEGSIVPAKKQRKTSQQPGMLLHSLSEVLRGIIVEQTLLAAKPSCICVHCAPMPIPLHECQLMLDSITKGSRCCISTSACEQHASRALHLLRHLIKHAAMICSKHHICAVTVMSGSTNKWKHTLMHLKIADPCVEGILHSILMHLHVRSQTQAGQRG